MKKAPYKVMSLFLRVTLEFVFYAGLTATIAIPFVLHYSRRVLERYFWFFRSRWFGDELFASLFIVTFGAAALVIVRQLILIFKSVNEDKPFIRENASRLNRIAVCCFTLFGIFLFKSIYAFTLLSVLMTAALLVASFAALVFGGLFFMAVEYKSENDLTI
jgi:hypothetical protein